mmetsp:Transcript_10418/g.45228  ORF Transcript_10418/g.45228 Transcript_10418/m.45228 type:complete len:237 (-) Transcript_10418:836-1546(-)
MVHSQYCSASITSRFVLNTSSTRLASLMKCGWFGASLAAQLACSRSKSRSKSFRPSLLSSLDTSTSRVACICQWSGPIPAFTSRLYRRAGPIALTDPPLILPPPLRRIPTLRPNPSSEELELSEESNELVSVSDELVSVSGAALRPEPLILRPFTPTPPSSARDPSRIVPRTRPSSSNCDSKPVSPYSHSITPAKSSCRVWNEPLSRNPCLEATRRIVPCARSRSAIALCRSTPQR